MLESSEVGEDKSSHSLTSYISLDVADKQHQPYSYGRGFFLSPPCGTVNLTGAIRYSSPRCLPVVLFKTEHFDKPCSTATLDVDRINIPCPCCRRTGWCFRYSPYIQDAAIARCERVYQRSELLVNLFHS